MHLYRAQWVGLPGLALLPLLAMAGVFGETAERVTAASGALEIEVEYPSRIRTGQTARVDVVIRNPGAAPVGELQVLLDPRWLEGAANLLIQPAPETPFHVRLGPIAAGAESRLRLEFRWEHLWTREGAIVVTDAGAVTRIPVRTFILP